ncbi:unnamed protein product [Nezara viridula]|uniref:Neuropeptide n=1 Tax=Nezara viridula TaxID=85310 RepID=A0A9P0HE83_NEZVI|nr:unnamed protein product [Nezara viridula]
MWWVLVLSLSLAIIMLLMMLFCCDWRTNKICSCSHQPSVPVAFREDGLEERWRMVSALSDEDVEERTETIVSLDPSELPGDLNRGLVREFGTTRRSRCKPSCPNPVAVKGHSDSPVEGRMSQEFSGNRLHLFGPEDGQDLPAPMVEPPLNHHGHSLEVEAQVNNQKTLTPRGHKTPLESPSPTGHKMCTLSSETVALSGRQGPH